MEVAMSIYSALPVTNCAAERSLSAFKQIKSEIKLKIDNKKLKSLMLLCTQSIVKKNEN